MKNKTTYELLTEVHSLELIRNTYKDVWVYMSAADKALIRFEIEERCIELRKRYNALPDEWKVK